MFLLWTQPYIHMLYQNKDIVLSETVNASEAIGENLSQEENT